MLLELQTQTPAQPLSRDTLLLAKPARLQRLRPDWVALVAQIWFSGRAALFGWITPFLRGAVDHAVRVIELLGRGLRPPIHWFASWHLRTAVL